jgi:hypothetical protein
MMSSINAASNLIPEVLLHIFSYLVVDDYHSHTSQSSFSRTTANTDSLESIPRIITTSEVLSTENTNHTNHAHVMTQGAAVGDLPSSAKPLREPALDLLSCAHVCRRWRSAVTDNVIWMPIVKDLGIVSLPAPSVQSPQPPSEPLGDKVLASSSNHPEQERQQQFKVFIHHLKAYRPSLLDSYAIISKLSVEIKSALYKARMKTLAARQAEFVSSQNQHQHQQQHHHLNDHHHHHHHEFDDEEEDDDEDWLGNDEGSGRGRNGKPVYKSLEDVPPMWEPLTRLRPSGAQLGLPIYKQVASDGASVDTKRKESGNGAPNKKRKESDEDDGVGIRKRETADVADGAKSKGKGVRFPSDEEVLQGRRASSSSSAKRSKSEDSSGSPMDQQDKFSMDVENEHEEDNDNDNNDESSEIASDNEHDEEAYDQDVDADDDDDQPYPKPYPPKSIFDREDDLQIIRKPLTLFEDGLPAHAGFETWYPASHTSSSMSANHPTEAEKDLAMLYHLLSAGQDIYDNETSDSTSGLARRTSTPYALFGAFSCYREWYLMWMLPREKLYKIKVVSREMRMAKRQKVGERLKMQMKGVWNQRRGREGSAFSSRGSVGGDAHDDDDGWDNDDKAKVNRMSVTPEQSHFDLLDDEESHILHIVPFAESNMFEWLGVVIDGPPYLKDHVIRFGPRTPFSRAGIPAETTPYISLAPSLRSFLKEFRDKLMYGEKPFLQRDIVQIFRECGGKGTGSLTNWEYGIRIDVSAWEVFYAGKFCYRIRMRYLTEDDVEGRQGGVAGSSSTTQEHGYQKGQNSTLANGNGNGSHKSPKLVGKYPSVQLKLRRWRFETLQNQVQSVEGEGVIGHFPLLSASTPFFEYCSYGMADCASMEGEFVFVPGSLGNPLVGPGNVPERDVVAKVPKVVFERASWF